jgi:hypothetical protein
MGRKKIIIYWHKSHGDDVFFGGYHFSVTKSL